MMKKSHGCYFNEIVLYKKWAIQLIPYTDGMKSGFSAKKGRKIESNKELIA